jgi:DNA-binding GntR family transcriptional regulator
LDCDQKDQMMKADKKTRPKWRNDKLKRAKGTTGVIPVRRPSGVEEDTLQNAAEFPDEVVDRSAGKGSRGTKAHLILRQAIAMGRLKPGDRVLESEMAALLNMSRTPVREAIAALEAEGLVSIDGAGGRVVTKLDYQTIMELYTVRAVLESTAAALAARNASEMEIVALRDMLEIEEQVRDDASKRVEHNRRFHEAIYYCSHNRYILKMLQNIQTGMLLLGDATRIGDDRLAAALREHTAIVEAIAARDPEAAEAAVREHIRNAQQVRVKLLLQTGEAGL